MIRESEIKKMSKKEVMALAENSKVLKVGYCNIQHLLNYNYRIGYNSGVYGWNYDVHNINGTILITGYRPFETKRVNYEMAREYDQKAEVIAKDRTLSYEERKEQINNLLYELIEKVK